MGGGARGPEAAGFGARMPRGLVAGECGLWWRGAAGFGASSDTLRL